MGDGGSIPKREELVKLKKRKERDEQNRNKWGLCAFSKQPLVAPIVACKLGYLYNKTAILEALLEGNLPSEFSHIKKAKRDLINVNLNSVSEVEEKPKFICPVTGLTLGGNYRFIAMKNCGCVIAERALKEIPDRSVCLNCSTKINNPDTDILILNGTEEEVNAQRELLRSGKKDKTKSRKRKLD